MTLIFPVQAKVHKAGFGEGVTLQVTEKQIHLAQIKGSSILNLLLPLALSLSLSFFISVFLLIGLGAQNKDSTKSPGKYL